VAVIEGECTRVDRDPGRLIVTPHPVLLDGQRSVAVDLQPGETLGQFLARHVDLSADVWEVRIGGVLVPSAIWHLVKPKHGQVIEVRGAVHENALYYVAMAVLIYFTGGAGATWAGGIASATGISAGAIYAAAYVAGAILINKVLGPKPPKANNRDPDSVFSLSAARNSPRPYDPLPLLFGELRITPDLASLPYTYFSGNDQWIAFVLCAGINVGKVTDLRNGDTLLSSYQGVATYFNGFSAMPDEPIPLHSNADTIAGAELNRNGTWVERTTPLDTVRVQIDLEYILGDMTAKGKDLVNRETVVAEYRPKGTTSWQSLQTLALANYNYDTKRRSIIRDLPRGQYDIRVRRLGQAVEIERGKAQFAWTTLTAVQADDADYAGIARIGISAKATGQLNGAMDEVRCLATAAPLQMWTGAAWITAATRADGLSNPGAQILAYARGFRDENGRIIAGIGLADEQIDIEALKGFMRHCAAEGYTYDHYLKDARSHDDVLNAIALAGFGQVTWAGGRLSVVWAASGQPLSGVVNMATIKKGQFQVDYTIANAADGIEYSYLDRSDWQVKTLRVAAPGVTTILSPAQVQGEGVTTEAHAARLARWHMAQSLYQYKDISYSTDLEHLSYRRLSVLALQHDLTQWGYGGRVRSATKVGSVVTLTLDEPVPQPATGNAYIGLRIPGETAYRVFAVQAFSGTSETITLVDAWPSDAALPGDVDENPAHDTIWIYDFKQTPGYRVRVVAIEPESDLKGARVAVVPESSEFWTYVHTGAYQPPPNQSLLPARPAVSALKVTERQVVQGNTVFTEFTVAFDASGPLAHAVVYSSLQVDGEWQPPIEVAQTSTRAASWRVEAAGTYAISVHPFDAAGTVGAVGSTTYVTGITDLPPPALDAFVVAPLAGGLRRYTWGYTSFQPADYVGAEIRYIAGTHTAPQWDLMTPLGESGFFTAAVELATPAAGTWTFAARARNASGALGPAKIVSGTLTGNVGEVIGGINANVSGILQSLSDIASDGLLTPGEKPSVIRDRDVLLAEQFGVDAQAASYGITTERTAYNAALSALTSYLAGLTSPVLWSDLSGNTTIVGATFRQKFADVLTARQALINAITAKAKLLADTAQTTANTAVTNAANAQAAANAANAELANIANDDLLTPGEKPTVIRDNNVILTEQAGIDAQAAAYGITTERTAYGVAVSALTSYLATLTSPYLWSNLVGNTAIVGTTFRQKFADVYTARQALLNKIAERARTLAINGSSGRNLIANASFEINTVATPAGANLGTDQLPFVDYWKVITPGTRPTSYVRWANGYRPVTGNASAQLTMQGEAIPAGQTYYGAAIEYTGAIQLQANQRYRLRAWIAAFANSGLSGCTMTAAVSLAFYSSTGAVLGAPSAQRTTLGEMAECVYTGVAPAGTSSVRLVIQPTITNGTGSTQVLSGIPLEMVVDDIELSILTELGTDVDGHLLDNRRLPQIMVGNGRAKVPTTITYAASAGTPATGTINVGAFTVLGGDYTLTYSASSVGVSGTGGSTVQYFLYMDDPNHVGGARTLVASTNGNDIYGSSGRIYIGDCAVTFPTSGSAGGGGGRDDRCVTEAMWLNAATRAGAALDGMEFDVIDLPNTGTAPRRAPVRVLGRKLEACVRLVTDAGFELDCSRSTPFDLPDGRTALAPDMLGEQVWTDAGWQTVGAVEDIGPQPVVYLSFGGLSFAAGRDPARRIYSHNLQQKP